MSEADHASEAAVREILDARAGHPVLGEEAAASAPTSGGSSTRSTAPPTSCTGSPRSACRSGSCTTASRWSVSCTRRCCGPHLLRPAAGGGAFRDGEPIRVSDRAARAGDRRDRLPVPAQASCCPSYFPRASSAALHRFEDLRRAGAASLDLCWTAAGVFDGYFELRLGPWDVAAGALLVREAGGVVTDWAGDRQVARQRRHRRGAAGDPRRLVGAQFRRHSAPYTVSTLIEPASRGMNGSLARATRPHVRLVRVAAGYQANSQVLGPRERRVDLRSLGARGSPRRAAAHRRPAVDRSFGCERIARTPG